MRLLRAYLLNIPIAVFCFSMFYLCGTVSGIFGASPQSIARFYSRLLLHASGVRVRTQGLSRLPRRGIFVLVSNHQSLADTPVLLAHLPIEFRFLAKQSLFAVPVIGWHLRRGGHISVLREDARGAANSLARAAHILAASLASVLLFAEGTRSSGQLQSFKGGAAHLAIKSKVPVVPIALIGTGDILPKGAITLRPGTAHLLVGEPIATDSLTPADRARLTARLEQEVAALISDAPAA